MLEVGQGPSVLAGHGHNLVDDIHLLFIFLGYFNMTVIQLLQPGPALLPLTSFTPFMMNNVALSTLSSALAFPS